MNVKNHVINVPDVKKIGVYAIHNILNNKYYIGSSVNINARMKSHRSNIENLHGSNLKFNKDLKKESDIKNFEFIVLETFEDFQITEKQLRSREEYYIKMYDAYSGYNVEKRPPSINGYFSENEYLVCKDYSKKIKEINAFTIRKMTNHDIIRMYANLLSENSFDKNRISIFLIEREMMRRMGNEM